MFRIAFSGVPSSGKTTLARNLSGVLVKEFPRITTVDLISEYARDYIDKFGPPSHPSEQLLIFEKQLSREDPNIKPQVLITDSPLFLGLKYARDLSDGSIKSGLILNELFSRINSLNYPAPRYDILFHVPPRSIVDDGIRKPQHLDPKWQQQTENSLIEIMNLINQPFIKLPLNTEDDQLAFCIKTLKLSGKF